nr:hypothetical protein [Tanacetum cinerariifolium]
MTFEKSSTSLGDTTSVIDHYLGSMVLGKPFVEASGLVYDKDNIPPFIITDDDSNHEKTHYSNGLNLGLGYGRDENVTKAIQCLMKLKSRANIDEGVTIWEALGGYTRDLDSFGKKTGQDCSFTTQWFQELLIEFGDDVAIS